MRDFNIRPNRKLEDKLKRKSATIKKEKNREKYSEKGNSSIRNRD